MESIKELREICQKPIKKKDTNMIYELTSRKLSIYATKLCLLLRISANQVTLFFNFLMHQFLHYNSSNILIHLSVLLKKY